MREIELPKGARVPALGQGTWRMGEDPSRADAEREALICGIELGMTLIDTAEMYGNGATERLLAAVLAGGRRDGVFLVSKALPQNAGRRGLPAACEASLRRLRTDRLDLYLLHWPGSVPLAETVEAMEALVAAGKIGAWGVSNFDAAEMDQLVMSGGGGCATNQVLYNVARRGPEFDLVPWLATHRMPLMAYSPVEQGRLPTGGVLREVADRHEVKPTQVALAWAMRDGAIAIPKAGTVGHVRENRRAADLTLSAADLPGPDAAFPPPSRKVRLAMRGRPGAPGAASLQRASPGTRPTSDHERHEPDARRGCARPPVAAATRLCRGEPHRRPQRPHAARPDADRASVAA